MCDVRVAVRAVDLLQIFYMKLQGESPQLRTGPGRRTNR